MTRLRDGQYRDLASDEGWVYKYQCMWCMNVSYSGESGRYWNFCPKCGKSWFQKKECRHPSIPRWAYEKWGNNPPHEANIHCHPRHEATAIWVFEWRSNVFHTPWSPWAIEYDCDKDPVKNDYKWAYSTLQRMRADKNGPYDRGHYEYRVRLVKKKDLTFTVPGVDFSEMTEGQKLIRNLYQKYCYGK
jgi:hypothetical protein